HLNRPEPLPAISQRLRKSGKLVIDGASHPRGFASSKVRAGPKDDDGMRWDVRKARKGPGDQAARLGLPCLALITWTGSRFTLQRNAALKARSRYRAGIRLTRPRRGGQHGQAAGTEEHQWLGDGRPVRSTRKFPHAAGWSYPAL